MEGIVGKNNLRNKRYKLNRRIARKAQLKVKVKVSKGILIKPSQCSFCNKIFNKNDIQGHHFNYKHYSNVIWVCQDCHSKIHTNKILKQLYCKVEKVKELYAPTA